MSTLGAVLLLALVAVCLPAAESQRRLGRALTDADVAEETEIIRPMNLLKGTGRTIMVGGEAGWGLRINKTWTPPTLRVGDRLAFDWTQSSQPQDVWRVWTKRAFDRCTVGPSTAFLMQSHLRPFLYFTPVFVAPGTYYYATSARNGRNCMAGQKIAIQVIESNSHLQFSP